MDQTGMILSGLQKNGRQEVPDEVSLQASSMGKQVYEKLGFKEAGIVSTWLLKK